MKTNLLLLLLFAGLATATQVQAQRCNTYQHQADLESQFPAIAAERLLKENAVVQMLQNNPEYRTSGVVTIPVVFHIIYKNSAQNIPDNRIFDQVNVLNQDFARLNANAVNTRSMFLPVAVNTQVQFCLAQQTPTGASTNGIVRISNPAAQFPNNPNSLSPEWDHTRYLNIYVGDIGPLGYANFPPGTAGSDHVVILFSTVGGPSFPGTYQPYHLGRTVTHEVGHWLNLHHTFNNGCAGLTNNTCLTAGDRVCDTPPVQSSVWGCPTNTPNTCTETSPFPTPYVSDMVDMYENFMDYTDDDCMNVFTAGQASRMSSAITQYRSQLVTSPGCIPVGINEFPDANLVTVSPNPSADGQFVIHSSLPSNDRVKISVYDLNGKLILENDPQDIMNGTLNLKLDQPSGVYQLKVENSNGYLIKKLVIAGN